MHAQATLVRAAQGTTLLQPGVLLRLLQRAMEEQGALLVAARAEQEERVRACVHACVEPYCGAWSGSATDDLLHA
jgi:hypothetical protein